MKFSAILLSVFATTVLASALPAGIYLGVIFFALRLLMGPRLSARY